MHLGYLDITTEVLYFLLRCFKTEEQFVSFVLSSARSRCCHFSLATPQTKRSRIISLSLAVSPKLQVSAILLSCVALVATVSCCCLVRVLKRNLCTISDLWLKMRRHKGANILEWHIGRSSRRQNILYSSISSIPAGT